ncbi:MAG: polyamine aminopropyltransferase [bacterium]|nr:polyamine aminopropyltransferase [bacterium]
MPGSKPVRQEKLVIIISVFIAGLCSIIYELLISTTSSYFLGDSIKQFSLTIGLYMAAMGVGSYFSRLIQRKLLEKFIVVEIFLGLLGGLSVPLLYFGYAYTNFYLFFMFFLIIAIGLLIGLEIPLLTRIMEKYYSLKFNISNILSLDYFGALIATLIFPFFLLPFLGIFKSSLFFGIINMVIGFLVLWCFRDKVSKLKRHFFKVACSCVTILFIILIFTANFLMKNWSSRIYEDRIIFAKQTNYQKIILTKNKKDIRLFLNGNLQFSSIDEYRYHEPLVHIPLAIAPHKAKVLVFGGGDGLVLRELLKYPSIREIDLVDIDPEIIKMAKNNSYLKKMNLNSFKDQRVKVYSKDAFLFIRNSESIYDIIIIDLPDPNNISIARLYSKEFYAVLQSKLASTGILVTQATSPFFANKSFWCIYNTINSLSFKSVYPYHVYVPSFGDWGFVMASKIKVDYKKINISVPTRYLGNDMIAGLFQFEKDINIQKTELNTMDNPKVLKYYLEGWRHWD